jgi:hypothetical protein
MGEPDRVPDGSLTPMSCSKDDDPHHADFRAVYEFAAKLGRRVAL